MLYVTRLENDIEIDVTGHDAQELLRAMEVYLGDDADLAGLWEQYYTRSGRVQYRASIGTTEGLVDMLNAFDATDQSTRLARGIELVRADAVR